MKKMLLSIAMISLISFGASAQNQKKTKKEKEATPTEQPAADPAIQAQPATDHVQEMSTPVQQPATPVAQPDPAQGTTTRDSVK